MPFATTFCACNGRTDNPMSHWRDGGCGIPPGPWATRMNAITLNETGDTLHAEGRLTATRTMACVRAVIIEDLEPGLYLDPRAHETAYEGTQAHREFSEMAAPGTYVALRFPIEGRPAPHFLGVPLYGEIDFLSPDMTRIDDLKTHGTSLKAPYPWKLGKEVEPEDEVQTNLYRFAVKQMFAEEGVDPQTLRLWHKWRAPARPLPDRVDLSDLAATKEARSGWWYCEAQPRSEEWIANVKPFGGRYAIGESFDMYRWVLAKIREGKSVREALQGVPLQGEERFFGKGCTHYCSPGVRDKCRIWAGRAPTWDGAHAAYASDLDESARRADKWAGGVF